MPGLSSRSIRLFRFSGIDVFLHWSWFLVALYEIQSRAGRYSSITWNVIEYLALFLIILLHEFGHAFACRQVGGRADRIVLWPLGGVAYVNPPMRPGAMLWSIAAGPLVNVAFFVIFVVAGYTNRATGWADAIPNLHPFLVAGAKINFGLLVFNLLPIYPLDGGQILRSLLWFVLGRARSLMAVTVMGFGGVAGLILLALWLRSVWCGVVAAYILMICWGGLQQARALLKVAKLPRRDGFLCPACLAAPPVGNVWKCGRCGQSFDTFQTGAVCPQCSSRFTATRCLDCGALNPLSAWSTTVAVSAPAAATPSGT